MLSPELEKRLMEVCTRAHQRGIQQYHVTPEELARDVRPLLADLEARALSARAEALEEAAKIGDYCPYCGSGRCGTAIRALAQTQPPDVSKEI